VFAALLHTTHRARPGKPQPAAHTHGWCHRSTGLFAQPRRRPMLGALRLSMNMLGEQARRLIYQYAGGMLASP
jgi:hypothetical protein